MRWLLAFLHQLCTADVVPRCAAVLAGRLTLVCDVTLQDPDFDISNAVPATYQQSSKTDSGMSAKSLFCGSCKNLATSHECGDDAPATSTCLYLVCTLAEQGGLRHT